MRLGTDEKVKRIASVPLFSGLSKRELSQVASIADEIDLREGKVLIREGDRGREFFVLLEGQVSVERGKKRLPAMQPGDFFGEVALVSNVPRTATVTATSPVRALVITDGNFRALVKRSPQIALKVLAAVAARLPHDEL